MKKNVSVSLPNLFKGFFAKKSVAVEWPQVFNCLTGGGLREATERYRSTKDWNYKSSLPSLTPACGTNGCGKEEADITGLTGVSMADFDGIQPAVLEAVRAVVNTDPHTLLSYVTVSGEGLRVLFRYEAGSSGVDRDFHGGEAAVCEKDISGKESGSFDNGNRYSGNEVSYVVAGEAVFGQKAFPCEEKTSREGTGISPEEKRLYEKAFLLGNCYYADLIGHSFDEKCANVNRLSALCHDPKAFFNEEAVPFRPEEYLSDLSSSQTDIRIPKESGSFPKTDFPVFSANTCFSKEKGLVDMPEEAATSPVTSTVPSVTAMASSPVTATASKRKESKSFSQSGTVKFSSLKTGCSSHRSTCVETPVSLTAYAAGVIEKHGDFYTKGNRNQYLMKCLMMMNRLGVPQTEAEGWALSHDLGETEIRRIVRSCYGHTAEHGVYEAPGKRNSSDPIPAKCCNVANVADDFLLTHTRAREEDGTIPLPPPPLFPSYAWPRFLGRIVDCGENAAQRDALLLGALTVLGASLNRRVRFLYGRKLIHPCLQVFVVAPPASGKGALTWVRKLVEPLHNRMMGEYYRAMEVYKQEKTAFEQAGRAKAGMKAPELPPMKMFLIAGNNSATGVLENLMDADGVGLICESEADTVSAAIGTDYGHWSDTLRKAFDHDRLSYNRRTNREYREISRTFLSVLLSGTPAQVQPLIPSAENGLFSRQLFYCMPATTGWVSQFGGGEGNDDLDRCFEAWGKEWEQHLQELVSRASVLTFALTDAQEHRFNHAFTCLFDTACITQNGSMKSSVTRLAVNILRLMSVVAFLRASEKGEGFLPANDIPEENVADGTATRFTFSITEEDFEAVLALARPLYQHAAYTLTLLPEVEVTQRKMKIADVLLSRLGEEFTSSQAHEEAIAMGIADSTLRSYLQRLTKEGTLLRTERGCYRFSRARTCV